MAIKALNVVRFLAICATAYASWLEPAVLDACPGYKASHVHAAGSKLTADLTLAGKSCNVYGTDLQKLKLEVDYETNTRIHVKITDATNARYEVPESVLPRPKAHGVSPHAAEIQFNYTTSPFSFSIYRTATREVLFSTASHPIIFEPQYLRVKTNLPNNPNIYGLGEHTNPFHLPDNTTLTLWSRDAYGVPQNSNLYGNHPVYFEHRTTGTHGVLLLNSNGMDIKLNSTDGANSLEYNAIGGVLDFYFFAGSRTDPAEVGRQYSEVAGKPAEVPYWSFGLHQCRFGYENYIDVAEVIGNYSAAGIPLETMWTDIDYMDRRRIFTVDPDYFPLPKMREIVSYLHKHDQRFVLMTDPAIAYLPGENYGPFDRGTKADVWLKMPDGKPSLGLVWPGVTVYPDWFHPNIQKYWSNEFAQFYSPSKGVDIDGAWIDMNEPSNFCDLPCTDPFEQAKKQALPPPRTAPPPPKDVPIFTHAKRAVNSSGVDLLNPPYAIENDAATGELSSKTAWTNATHANGLTEYDTHNLYGTMMSEATQKAMSDRRPGQKTLVITRSTFVGAGRKVGKWLGDNFSGWDHYQQSISGILGFAGIYQIPMVGADICGFAGNTTETLCARWAALGAFYPFMRNHNSDTSISQEYYRWDTVAQSAKNALDIRYRLMDYLYTAFHQAHTDGTPVIQPLWFHYPKDTNTFSVDTQFFFGSSILVSPVINENSTSVNAYFPKENWFDFSTHQLLKETGTGAQTTLANVSFTQIPVHIRGGSVLPLRVESAMTTTALRKKDFEFVVAPAASNGQASGSLYIDDGISVVQQSTTSVQLAYTPGNLKVTGHFGFKTGVKVANVKVLGVSKHPKQATVNGKHAKFAYDANAHVLDITVGLPLNQQFSVHFD